MTTPLLHPTDGKDGQNDDLEKVMKKIKKAFCWIFMVFLLAAAGIGYQQYEFQKQFGLNNSVAGEISGIQSNITTNLEPNIQKLQKTVSALVDKQASIALKQSANQKKNDEALAKNINSIAASAKTSSDSRKYL